MNQYRSEEEEVDLEILEATSRPTERQSIWKILDSRGRTMFVSKEEQVFRAELATLMDEYHGNLHISHYLDKHSETLLQAIHKRLASQGLYVSKEDIRTYLKRINHVFKAILANGGEVSAIPFLGKPKPKASRRKKPKLHKGKKRPLYHKGKLYPSVRQAALDTGDNYNSLKDKTRRDINQI